MIMALVSIILPVFNGEKTIEKAVQSIINQSFTDWEMLILDDGSTDRTAIIIKNIADARINFIPCQHQGIVARLNQGIDLAKGKYIARMDADDVAHSTRLEKQVRFLETHSQVDLVGTAMNLFSEEGNFMDTRVFAINHEAIIATPWLKTISMAHPTWCGRTAWFKKWKYKTGFNRNEDQELLLRARLSSCYANLNEVLVDYKMNNSWQKKYKARIGWLKALWHHFGKKGNILVFLLGTMTTLCKLLLDRIMLKIQL